MSLITVFVQVGRVLRALGLAPQATMSSTAKKAKLDPVTIGTHNGCFHADEALAIAMLTSLPRYKDANIVRTRDPEKLKPCDIVVDVGAEYDPATHRYDHHQRSFVQTLKDVHPEKKFTTKLSSAGLVYAHFGHEVIATLTQLPQDSPIVDLLFDKMYKGHVEEFDGIDNGVACYDGEGRYEINSTISARVGRLVPAWNDKETSYDEQFQKAVALVRSEFEAKLFSLQNVWLPARKIVEEAIAKRLEVDESGEIIEFESSCPWKSHLYDIENDLKKNGEQVNIKYALYADNSGKWRVQCVSVSPSSFENRKSLPKEWHGVRDDELSKLSGISGCIFVHANGFIGGNATKEGALAMARAGLKA